ncbi:SHOCT domain-containing protein [Pseudonocardia bannensis]|uniref:SHOCT domain-containing protein n=2 Tax=Pseudonocardia bannensis TaxID=630973 RepID=A0A848DER1_9PSEU|nr:SHOCT domain-containing protein [Pseudonocardia bannensis]
MMGGWGGPMMGWFWIWPALVLVGLVLLGFAAYQLVLGRGAGSPTDLSVARRILEECYVRGEIDEQEYRRRRAELP